MYRWRSSRHGDTTLGQLLQPVCRAGQVTIAQAEHIHLLIYGHLHRLNVEKNRKNLRLDLVFERGFEVAGRLEDTQNLDVASGNSIEGQIVSKAWHRPHPDPQQAGVAAWVHRAALGHRCQGLKRPFHSIDKPQGRRGPVSGEIRDMLGESMFREPLLNNASAYPS